MRRAIYQAHLILGILVSIPVLAWALSGFLYALPNMVEGGTVENIDAARINVAPAEAMAKANDLAGKTLPTTALTLLMKDGRPQYQSIGGLGADSIFIDAQTGEANFSKPPTWKTRFLQGSSLLFLCGKLASDAPSNLLGSCSPFGRDGHLSKHLLLVPSARP